MKTYEKLGTPAPIKFPGAQWPRACQNPCEVKIELFRGTTRDESVGFWRRYMLHLEMWLRSFYRNAASAEGNLEKRRRSQGVSLPAAWTIQPSYGSQSLECMHAGADWLLFKRARHGICAFHPLKPKFRCI